MHTSPGRATEAFHLFQCRVVRAISGPRSEPAEFISVVEVPLDEAVERALPGEITAATTVLGLLMVSGLADGGAGCA